MEIDDHDITIGRTRHEGARAVRLHEDAGTVASIGLAAASASVIEIYKDAEGLLDNGVGLASL